MSSLNAHLRQSEDHGSLAFHPDCPVCRVDRLSGTMPSQSIVTRRSQAAVLAGILAASTAAPTVAAAQEQDQISEGAVAPEQVGEDLALDPDFDPGGESDDLPLEAAPVADAGGADPIEVEPATDIDAPIVDAGDEAAEPEAVAPTPTPTPTPTVTPMPSPAPPVPEDPAQSIPPAEPAPEAATPGQRTDAGKKTEREHEPRDRRRKDPTPDVGQPVPAAPLPVVSDSPSAADEPVAIQVTQPAAPAPETVTGGTRAKRGDRVHVVLAGESLWSVARDVLGRDASPAAVAREVNRLWELNRTRIATGDPDLLPVGTRLALR